MKAFMNHLRIKKENLEPSLLPKPLRIQELRKQQQKKYVIVNLIHIFIPYIIQNNSYIYK